MVLFQTCRNCFKYLGCQISLSESRMFCKNQKLAFLSPSSSPHLLFIYRLLRKGDVALLNCTAIVNTSNENLTDKNPVSESIFMLAGPDLKEELQKLKGEWIFLRTYCLGRGSVGAWWSLELNESSLSGTQHCLSVPPPFFTSVAPFLHTVRFLWVAKSVTSRSLTVYLPKF